MNKVTMRLKKIKNELFKKFRENKKALYLSVAIGAIIGFTVYYPNAIKAGIYVGVITIISLYIAYEKIYPLTLFNIISKFFLSTITNIGAGMVASYSLIYFTKYHELWIISAPIIWNAPLMLCYLRNYKEIQKKGYSVLLAIIWILLSLLVIGVTLIHFGAFAYANNAVTSLGQTWKITSKNFLGSLLQLGYIGEFYLDDWLHAGVIYQFYSYESIGVSFFIESVFLVLEVVVFILTIPMTLRSLWKFIKENI